MDSNQIISILVKFSTYIEEWSKFLTSTTEQAGAKQSYFLDTKEDIIKIKTRIKDIIGSNPTEEILNSCVTLNEMIENTVRNFTQSASVMNENITKEETIPVVNEETMAKALQSNKSTQRMVSNMTELEKQQAAVNATPFTHMLDIDGKLIFINASSKEELEKVINDQVKTEKETPKEINLYELNPKKIQLTTKTIVAIA